MNFRLSAPSETSMGCTSKLGFRAGGTIHKHLCAKKELGIWFSKFDICMARICITYLSLSAVERACDVQTALCLNMTTATIIQEVMKFSYN